MRGGGVISDPTDCHRAIAALAADATATLHLVTSTPAPDGEGKIPKELTDALKQLVDGCNADDAALADASVELYLPGQVTVDALDTVVTTDQSLQMF